MRHRRLDVMQRIIDFVDSEYQNKCKAPSIREIAEKLSMPKSCISDYIAEMVEKGLIENSGESRGIITKTMKQRSEAIQLPIIGTIACGDMMFAEQSVRGYLSVSSEIFGKGEFYVLETSGDSMIKAGISSGDYVIIRIQPTAEQGQIVVANIGEEATLKRYYRDEKNKRIRLHPENDTMQDMYFDNIKIQGIVVKVIKNVV